MSQQSAQRVGRQVIVNQKSEGRNAQRKKRNLSAYLGQPPLDDDYELRHEDETYDDYETEIDD